LKGALSVYSNSENAISRIAQRPPSFGGYFFEIETQFSGKEEH